MNKKLELNINFLLESENRTSKTFSNEIIDELIENINDIKIYILN